MSDLSFEQMLEESLKTIRNGEKVDGKVISVKEDEIVLNIGYKSDGIISRSEYTNQPNVDLTTLVKPGDEMQAIVVRVNDGEGQVLLSYKRLASQKSEKAIEEAFNNKEVLKGKVTQVVTGGLTVIVGESKVFIPASLASDKYEEDLKVFLNQEIEFVITDFDPQKRRIIGNRKQLIVEQKKIARAELLNKIQVGESYDGIVKNILDFGVFVDIGGVDGLLHVSEMSWFRTGNPKKDFKVGDKIKVFVKDVNGSKIYLSAKFEDENPWKNADEEFAVGNIVKGKVVRLTDFGAFVELKEHIDALLHVSQISRERIGKPSDVLSIGQEIEAKVIDYNEADKKIGISMKALLPEAVKNEEVTPDIVDVDIDKVVAESIKEETQE